MSTQEHHSTWSELGFTVREGDREYINEYAGDWVFTGETPVPDNFWLVTMDGEGHPVNGHMSPQQILDWGQERGWHCAYVAPYGRHVIGEKDEIQLHDWLRDRQDKDRPRRHHGVH